MGFGTEGIYATAIFYRNPIPEPVAMHHPGDRTYSYSGTASSSAKEKRIVENYSLSRILFDSLVSIRFISRESVPAEIDIAENSSKIAPAIAQPMCITPIAYLSVRTHSRIPILGTASRPAINARSLLRKNGLLESRVLLIHWTTQSLMAIVARLSAPAKSNLQDLSF